MADQDTGLEAREAVRLLMAHRGMLNGYIASLTGNPGLVEDVFQELSVLVLEKHAQIYNARAFPSWARSTARHLVLRQLRKTNRSPLSMDQGLLESLDEQWDGLEATEAESDKLNALRKCLGALTPRARKLVAMRYEQNRNGKQIAQTMDRPLNTIYVSMSRIHKRLAECIQKRLGLGRSAG